MEATLGSDGRVYIKSPFAMKDQVKSLTGSRWSAAKKRWSIPASPPAVVEMIEKFPNIKTDEGVRALALQSAQRADAQSTKVRTDLPPIPTSTDAWEHQRQAYHFVMDAALSGAMLQMGMGTGKSLTVVGLLEGMNAKTAIITCPPKVVRVWPKQFRLHALEPDRWHVIVPPERATVNKRALYVFNELRLARARGQRAVIVINYEAAWREAMSKLLLQEGADVLYMDESHKIKAPGGKASKFMARLGDHCTHRIAGTGTPMPHSPLDVYAQYRVLDPGVYGTSFARFRARYAVMGGFEGRQVVDWVNQDDLAQKFASIAYICSEDVLDLPEMLNIDREFELAPRARRAYGVIDSELILEVENGRITTSNALDKLLKLQQITSGFLKDEDGNIHEVSTDKSEMLAEVLDELPLREPVVVFARFHHDLDRIARICDEQGRSHGEVSGRVRYGDERYGLTVDSTMRDDIDVCIVQEQSGGTGVDLTRACYGIYYSLSYSLGDFDQSLRRILRPGQTRPVRFIHLVAVNTNDRVIYNALESRREVVEAVIEAARRERG